MIRDQKFWSVVRGENQQGDTIFRCFLTVLHSRQANLTVRSTNVELEKKRLRQWTKKHQCCEFGQEILEDEKKKRNQMIDEEQEYCIRKFNDQRKKGTLELDSSPSEPLSSSTIRVLQRIMLFAVPVSHLRYKMYAISLAKRSSCFLDQLTKELILFGCDERIIKPSSLSDQGCAIGDNFYASIDSRGMVAINSSPQKCKKEEINRADPGDVFPFATMIVSNGCRLACLNKFGEVCLLSSNPYSDHCLFPTLCSSFVALDSNFDAFAVGTNSRVYKVGRNDRELSSPRSVMPFSRIAISRIAAGKGFIVAIDQCGRLLMQGTNHNGVLGLGTFKIVGRRLVHISEFFHFFVQVAAGELHALALSSSGYVYGSGSNEMGQLGLGPEKKKASRFTLITLPQPCDGIAAGAFASAFVLRDGSVYVCGDNREGQLGVFFTDSNRFTSSSTNTSASSIVTTDGIQGVVYEPTHVKRIRNGVAFAYLSAVSEDFVFDGGIGNERESETSSRSFLHFLDNNIKSAEVSDRESSVTFSRSSSSSRESLLRTDSTYDSDSDKKGAAISISAGVNSHGDSIDDGEFDLTSELSSHVSSQSSVAETERSLSSSLHIKEHSVPIAIKMEKMVRSPLVFPSPRSPMKKKESIKKEKYRIPYSSTVSLSQSVSSMGNNREQGSSISSAEKETKKNRYPFSDENNKENERGHSPIFNEPISPENNTKTSSNSMFMKFLNLCCC